MFLNLDDYNRLLEILETDPLQAQLVDKTTGWVPITCAAAHGN
jgi:hypothetical protein